MSKRAVGVTMPFSKLNLDPEHIEAMHDAFRRVCDVLQLECELTKAGERDPEILCIDVLAETASHAAIELAQAHR
jgi:hypothetical protein